MARKSKKRQPKNQNKNTILGIFAIIILFVGFYFYKQVTTNEPTVDISGNFAVHFIDIGQGDSILIQTPDNEFMLIDTGEKNQYDKLNGYLKHFGVNKFKYIIFTHPHSDHIGSAVNIVKNYNIETLIMPPVTHTTKTFTNLIDLLEQKQIEITPSVCGDKYQFGDAEFTILAPNSNSYKSLNNYSVVISMTYGETTFLFTGDMEKESENEVIDFCKNNHIDLSVHVLKVAHHGSSTSSQQKFLNLLKPKYAIITCGEGNSYNLPNMKTVNRIETAGTKIYRTDLDGDIVILSDGLHLSVKKGREAVVEYKTEKHNGEEYETEQNEKYIEEN